MHFRTESAQPNAKVKLRIGITPYSSVYSKEENEKYAKLLHAWKKLATANGIDLTFKIDTGLNTEINSWATTTTDDIEFAKSDGRNYQIDVAVATAKVAANLISQEEEQWHYVTTRLGDDGASYGVSCITAVDTDESRLLEALKNGNKSKDPAARAFNVLFTDPLSTSGYSILNDFLTNKGLLLHIEASGSHGASIKRILDLNASKSTDSDTADENETDVPLFAFVTNTEKIELNDEGELKLEDLAAKKLFKIIDIKGLTDSPIPELAWISRRFDKDSPEFKVVELLKDKDLAKNHGLEDQ